VPFVDMSEEIERTMRTSDRRNGDVGKTSDGGAPRRSAEIVSLAEWRARHRSEMRQQFRLRIPPVRPHRPGGLPLQVWLALLILLGAIAGTTLVLLNIGSSP
jgi:hypothetical protein